MQDQVRNQKSKPHALPDGEEPAHRADAPQIRVDRERAQRAAQVGERHQQPQVDCLPRVAGLVELALQRLYRQHGGNCQCATHHECRGQSERRRESRHEQAGQHPGNRNAGLLDGKNQVMAAGRSVAPQHVAAGRRLRPRGKTDQQAAGQRSGGHRHGIQQRARRPHQQTKLKTAYRTGPHYQRQSGQQEQG